MNNATIAIIIILLTIIFYSSGKIPVAMVSILSLISMVLTGTLSFSEAFNGFSSSTIFTITGMMFIGQALFENGVAEQIGKFAFGKNVKDERMLVAKIFLMTAFLSAFLYNTSVIVMMMPIAASYVSNSNGNLKLKNFYMVLSHAVILGSRMTIIGADGFLIAHEVFETSSIDYRFGFFEPFPIMFITILILTFSYYYIIYPLGKRVYDLDTVMEHKTSCDIVKTYDKRKAAISAGVMVGVSLCAAFMNKIILFIPNINLGIISLMGAAILFLTKCINFEEQLQKLNLNTLIIVGSSYGFAACFLKTGLGNQFVELITSAGQFISSPKVLVLIFSIGSALITNLMANAATVTILTSLAITTASGLGISFVPLVMAAICGSASGVMLPTSTSTLTMSMEAGYKYTDYIIIGGTVLIISTLVESFMIMLVYGI